MSFYGLLNKVVSVYRKSSGGEDVEPWELLFETRARIYPLSPADIIATSRFFDINATHKIYTEIVDIAEGDMIKEGEQEFYVARIMKDSKNHHLEIFAGLKK